MLDCLTFYNRNPNSNHGAFVHIMQSYYYMYIYIISIERWSHLFELIKYLLLLPIPNYAEKKNCKQKCRLWLLKNNFNVKIQVIAIIIFWINCFDRPFHYKYGILGVHNIYEIKTTYLPVSPKNPVAWLSSTHSNALYLSAKSLNPLIGATLPSIENTPSVTINLIRVWLWAKRCSNSGD